MDVFLDAAQRFARSDMARRLEGVPLFRSDVIMREGFVVRAVDGGLSIIASRSNAALGVVKVATITASHPGIEAQTQLWVVTVFYDEGCIVSMRSMDGESFEHRFEGELETGFDVAREFLERRALARCEGFVLADGSLRSRFGFADCSNDVLGIVKRPSQARSGASAESMMSGFEGIFAHPLDGAYYARLHPLGRTLRIEGSLNRDRFETLVAASCDGAFPGYPYALVLADRFARISHREARSLGLHAAARFGIETSSLHDVLDSLEYRNVLER